MRGSRRRIGTALGPPGWAIVLAALALGCESSLSGTLAPLPRSTGDGSLTAGSSPAMGSVEPRVDDAAGGATGSVAPPSLTGAGAAAGEAAASFCGEARAACRGPVLTSEPLPGRPLPPVQTRVVETVSLQRIFEKFDAACGRCHAPPEVPDESNGRWVVGGAAGLLLDDEAVWREAIERIETLDPELAMPPTRDPTRPLLQSQRELEDTLRTWLDDAGRDPKGFTREVTLSAETPYRYPDALRLGMTNIGDCIPEPALVGCASSEMARLDEKFARVRSFADLPKRLEETDLSTLDSALLAEQRVISYAPTYTLFSDNAKKMRHLRVPAGEVISYDAEARDFDIPDNTRFYKTFLRKVVDRAGQPSYRKVETRIILARRDALENGVATPKAIFGTYLWSLDEARAELVELPYNDQTPFRDVPLRHVIDEERAARAPATIDPDTLDGIAAAFEHDELLRQAQPLAALDETVLLTRGYAVPGRDRCVQCHMGSSSQSFILGFNQYQADRRPGSEGGVFDAPAGEDELSQLARLIEYGVVRDATSPPDRETVRHRLEESQGERRARNEHELKAQGYMLGNCAFCHNPSGFPSIENPVLKDVLDFFPRGEEGGIFQFPLDTFSPRTSRTPAFNVRFPYITPSLFERLGEGEGNGGGVPTKSFQSLGAPVFVAAPWRSLLFRNVHTPFTYAHDEAIHPHMPLNVPGYDFRAAEVMGDWMLSIPARLAEGAENHSYYRDLDQPWVEVLPGSANYEDYVRAATLRRETFRSARIISHEELALMCPTSILSDCVDGHEAPGRAFLGGAAVRPDVSDVFAVEMRGAVPLDQPLDNPLLIVPGLSREPARITRDAQAVGPDIVRAGRWLDGVPDRPHWVPRDLTSIPGQWAPRGSRWESALDDAEEFVPRPRDLSNLSLEERERQQVAEERRRATALRVFHLQEGFVLSDELRRFALEAAPYGLWQEPEDGQTASGAEARCEELLPVAPRVADFQGDPPRWFAERGLDLGRAEDRSRLVYTQPPGETMFTLICSNCHGRAANGESLLANTILELTGGRTRVANLRDGIFGADGANRESVFPSEDVAVRYLLWMGLGGTEATIPSVVLNRVGATRPLGVDRLENPNAQATANMLDNAVGFCKDSIGLKSSFSRYPGLSFDHLELGPGVPEFDGTHVYSEESSLVASNGDATLWVELCGKDNPGPIRAVQFVGTQGRREEVPRFVVAAAFWRDLDGRSLLGESVRIGDHRGRVRVGLEPDNVLPWCVLRQGTSEGQVELEAVWNELPGRAGEAPPWCPEALFVGAGGAGLRLLEVAPLDVPDERRDSWATRGAMNVGASVFVYLDALSKGQLKAKPAHDACALTSSR